MLLLYYTINRAAAVLAGGLTENAAMVQRSCLSKNYDAGPDKEGKSRETGSFEGTLRLECRLVYKAAEELGEFIELYARAS